MEKITNYNCDGLCSEATCNKRYTQMERMTINGIDLIIAFCDEHAEQWEEYSWNKTRKLGAIFPTQRKELKGLMLHEFI
jgi:protein-tyrosine-phosphatase